MRSLRPSRSVVASTLLLLAMLAAPASVADGETEPAPAAEVRLAPLLDGMGDHHHPITTAAPMAQRFFDQGLTLAYAFNHAEAARAFREASRLDPECAMCAWGLALVLGPNINAAMDPEAAPEAWAALEEARRLAPGASEREQAYVAALGARYAASPPEDRAPLDAAYAEAMRALARRFPDDPDAATLYAEALMDTTPWDYWTEDGEPRPVTETILATLEGVLERHPRHPGANHLYIHAVEAVRPELGVGAAERLGELVPGAGHLVHMPSHIFIRVGRYREAAEANERAIVADDAYVTQCHAQGLYPLAYMPHNHHFLWAAATLEGRRAAALEAAQRMAAHVDEAKMREKGLETLQHYWVTPVYGMVRFGRWDEILALPAPAADLLYPRGVRHYARALALVRRGELDAAGRELAALEAIAADPALESITVWDINTTAALLAVARETVAGELALARGEGGEAVRRLERAVALEDGLNYDEPPAWHAPVRQTLGAVLLELGRAEDAERVYREDLENLPENGWSLHGLECALAAQGRDEEAAAVRARFRKAWERADVELAASRF